MYKSISDDKVQILRHTAVMVRGVVHERRVSRRGDRRPVPRENCTCTTEVAIAGVRHAGLRGELAAHAKSMTCRYRRTRLSRHWCDLRSSCAT